MLVLLSAERVLKQHVVPPLYDTQSTTGRDRTQPSCVSGHEQAAEVEADLHRRFASLDVRILKRAVDVHKLSHEVQDIDVERMVDIYASAEEDADRAYLQTCGCGEGKLSLFDSLEVVVPTYVFAKDIDSFEKARVIFLRAAARIEAAKKYFVLDGNCLALQCLEVMWCDVM